MAFAVHVCGLLVKSDQAGQFSKYPEGLVFLAVDFYSSRLDTVTPVIFNSAKESQLRNEKKKKCPSNMQVERADILFFCRAPVFGVMKLAEAGSDNVNDTHCAEVKDDLPLSPRTKEVSDSRLSLKKK